MTAFPRRILVTGGTGRLGRAVIPCCHERGWTVRIMSRKGPPVGQQAAEWMVADLANGAGLAAALAGVDVVLHLASLPYRGRRTTLVDVVGTRRLVEAAGHAGVAHVVYTSIVGVETIPWPYFRKKLAAEEEVRGGPVPWSIIRATQFYPLLDAVLSAAARLRVFPGPAGVIGRPVDPHDVAGRLIAAVDFGPSMDITEFAGPEVLSFADIVAQWLEATGMAGRIVDVPVPGRLGRAFRAGHAIPLAGEFGSQTWRSWLEGTYGPQHGVAASAG